MNTKRRVGNLIDTHNADLLVSSTCQIQVTGTASRSITFRGQKAESKHPFWFDEMARIAGYM